MGVIRLCGTRDVAAIYAECRLGIDGFPIEHFLIDPPVPVDKDELGITPRGVRLIQQNGIWHIFDWVGSEYYPNVADFVEEVRRLGLSRKLNPKMDFSKLTIKSRIVLLHSRAVIKNHKKYKSSATCPKGHDAHHRNEAMCVKLYWEDVEDGEPDPSLIPGEERKVKRRMPAFEYTGYERPSAVEPEYQLGIFASFPIHNLAVINDPDGKRHKEVFDRAKNSTIKVELTDQ